MNNLLVSYEHNGLSISVEPGAALRSSRYKKSAAPSDVHRRGLRCLFCQFQL